MDLCKQLLKLSTALGCGTLLALNSSVFAADHIDSPIVKNDPTADITDLYSFVNPNDPNEYILVANVVPFATQSSQFSDAVMYTFHLMNGAGVENTVTCTFGTPDPMTLNQTVTCTGPGNRMVEGSVGEVITNGDFRVFTGLRDDPFFFDFDAWKETVETGEPVVLAPGEDFFAGLNVLSIVVGLPISATNQNPGAKAHFNQRVWVTTDRVNGAGIGAGYTGAWFDPDQSGMGFLFEVIEPEDDPNDPDGKLLNASLKNHYSENLVAYWFFFEDNQPVWLHGVGSVDGDTVTVPLVYTIGGGDLGSFDESEVTRTPVGTLTIVGMSCNKAMISFESTDPRFPDVEFPIVRLTNIKNLECQFLTAGHIDRNGRPGITTFLIAKPTNDPYNREHDPSQWAPRFQDDIRERLMFIDMLDGNQGNQLLNYDALSALFADDRLTIATNIPNCGPYLAVELTPEGEEPAACGGRTLSADVIDTSLTALVGIEAADGVPSNDVPFLEDFPFVAPPQLAGDNSTP